MKPIFSVVIPCYNEEENLNRLFIKIETLLEKYPNAEVVLVNNGSSDDTLTQFNLFKLKHKFQNVTIGNLKENKGYGYGVLEGLKLAKADVLAWTHGNLVADVMDVGKAYDLYLKKVKEVEKCLLVKGVRETKKVSESILAFTAAALAGAKLNSWMQEITIQPKMFSRAFYEKVKKKAPNDSAIDLYWMHEAQKIGFIETFPVNYIKLRNSEVSIKSKWKTLKQTIGNINKLEKGS